MEVFKASLFLIGVGLWSVGCSGSPLNVCTANITESNNGSLVLLYTRVAAADNSTCMHFVWSTRGNSSSGFPTLFASYTENEEDVCTTECFEYLDSSNNSVSIPDTVDSHFSLGVVFTRLVEFLVDSKAAQSVDRFNETLSCHCDTAPKNDALCEDYGRNYSSVYLNDSNITWGYIAKNNSFVGIPIDPESGNKTDTRIYIKANFPASDEEGQRIPYFPQTPITANSTTIDLVVENFAYQLNNASDTNSANYSRVALELFLIHGPDTSNGSVSTYASLDDEYTPSVFITNTYEIHSPEFEKDENGYFQWKPISYQSSALKSTESQLMYLVYTAGNKYCDTEMVPEGLASRLLGNNTSNVTRWFAVFGTSEDATYLPTSYITWTTLVGYGKVPLDQISLVVIITIIVGLGIPALLVLLGGGYVVYKKKPWENVKKMVNKASGKQGGYTRLN